jgi:hypothetical protein
VGLLLSFGSFLYRPAIGYIMFCFLAQMGLSISHTRPQSGRF